MLSHINKTEEEAIEENNKVVIVNYPEGLFVHKIIETKKIFHQYITEIESNFANVKDRKFVYNFYITPSFLFANEVIPN